MARMAYSDRHDEEQPDFVTPGVVNNAVGWGPISIPEQFKDIPYQPFSKSDTLGQITDWTGNLLTERRYNKYNNHQQFGTGQHYSYFHEEDESSFQLVDTSKPQRSLYQRYRDRYQNRRNQRPTQRVQDPKTGRMTVIPRYNNMRRNNWNNRGHDSKSQVKLKSSVEVRKDWEMQVEIEFSQIAKLHLPYPEDKIINLEECGTLEYYDKRYDRVTTKAERPLQITNRQFYHVSTAYDDIIRELAKEGDGHVFATDSILATIMTCPRSYYSWDIIIQRVGSKLFFDKRDDSDLDMLTVNETANELPGGDGGSNSLMKLSLEATYINHNFSQQVLKREYKRYPRPNPFVTEDEDSEPSSVAYRYRKIPLLGPGEPLTLICRCEIDAITTNANGDELLMNIKALNEWDLKGGVSEWRQKLDTQRGDILTTEMKNNKCKLAKWTVSSILAGADLLKFGYVTRTMPRNAGEPVGYSILGTQQFVPKQFAAQISLDMGNAWGILRVIVDKCMKLKDGKYVLYKEPGKGILRIYKVPQNTFEENEDDSDDDK